MAEKRTTKAHVFADPDAEVIHQGLMLLVAAISDLKEMVALVHSEVVGSREP